MAFFAILGKTPDFHQPLMGFMDVRGNVTIEPQFRRNSRSAANHFSKAGYAIVQRPDAKQHIVIDRRGETVFELTKKSRTSLVYPTR